MGVVSADRCVACHRAKRTRSTSLIRQVEAHVRGGRRIPWERVYELPNWVVFDHRRHSRTGCAVCHGPVERRDALAEEVIMNMKFCRDCHLRTKAKAVCGTCHPEK